MHAGRSHCSVFLFLKNVFSFCFGSTVEDYISHLGMCIGGQQYLLNFKHNRNDGNREMRPRLNVCIELSSSLYRNTKRCVCSCLRMILLMSGKQVGA